MNIQKIFQAIKEQPDLSTLQIVVIELERQGYNVIINDMYKGSIELDEAEERDELKYLPFINGIKLKISNQIDCQEFKIHMLDIDRICFTQIESLPVIYNPEYTIELYKSN